jgi:hypothetical protein
MNLNEALNDLNALVLKGELFEAINKYYADDVIVMEKNDVVTRTRQEALDREGAILEGVEEWLRSEIKSTAVSDQVSMTEWHFEYKHKEYGHKAFDQVTVQHWNDEGKIVSERYYALYE